MFKCSLSFPLFLPFARGTSTSGDGEEGTEEFLQKEKDVVVRNQLHKKYIYIYI
ncbi:hypothetical protein, unlikely [Trypanosoma brucei brucei TREU927]|uniref:Uncharacterized protein n=1 Tax=Trypanosoma brucei brucei (strain 927/4 GUTat10.1) TaxID=185431 RepID=Q4GZ32_TRYB2|nr:hypothetical protein, unlikely [Trypanosoma brucei brucei TREU927]CAJ16233.1 hypothetical protein, unlikely [Trypanosoma brucei brucei TREU927]